MAYVIVAQGGKQYKLEKGRYYDIEKVPGDVDDKFEFTDIVAASGGEEVYFDSSHLKSVKVTGKIIEQSRAKAVTIFKFRRRKNSRRLRRHRQYYTRVLVEEMVGL